MHAQARVGESSCNVLLHSTQGAVLLASRTHVKAMEAKLELQSHYIVVAQTKQIEF